MVKKLKVTRELFSVAAKQARAAHREAQKAEAEQYQKMLDTTILTPERLAPLDGKHSESVSRGSFVTLEGLVIAEIVAGKNGVFVEIADGEYRSIQIHDVEACRPLLTYRKVLAATVSSGGSAFLAQQIRKREAAAEAERISAAIGSAPVATTRTRL